jgi:hypothetical protein
MNPFEQVDRDVHAAINEWGGLAALAPAPFVKLFYLHNEVAENRGTFGGRPTIWVGPVSSQSHPRYTSDTQKVDLKYRIYIVAPTSDGPKGRAMAYAVNAALIQFANWKRANGDALAAPSPWVYHRIAGPEVIDPSQYTEQERYIEGLLAVTEIVIEITAAHTDLMVVPDQTLTAASATIEAVEVGTITWDWDIGYTHIPDYLQVKYNPGVNKPVRRVSWMKFPLSAIADAVEISGLTAGYSVSLHDGLMASGSSVLVVEHLDLATAAAADAWAATFDENYLDATIDLSSVGAKTSALGIGSRDDLLEVIQGGGRAGEYWYLVFTWLPDYVTRACELDPTLALNTLQVNYTHYV